MKGAIEEYKEREANGFKPKLRVIARAWCVPKSTLQRRIKDKVKGHEHVSGRKQILFTESEEELLGHIKLLASRGFPFRRNDIQRLVYKFAQGNGIAGFSDATQQAGQYWMDSFLRRHSKTVGLRKPEGLSANRAGCVNRVTVGKWFEIYDNLLTSLSIKDLPSHIWNLDETGLQDHFLTSNAVGERGQPCFQITSGERGETTTVLVSFNAAGEYGPTLVIFKAKRLKPEWLLNKPRDTILRVSDSGWINSELLVDWGKQFVSMLDKNDPRPHVLLLDGHSSHVYNPDFLKLMKATNIHVMCYPAHATHHLQPADKSLFKSLKSHWTN